MSLRPNGSTLDADAVRHAKEFEAYLAVYDDALGAAGGDEGTVAASSTGPGDRPAAAGIGQPGDHGFLLDSLTVLSSTTSDTASRAEGSTASYLIGSKSGDPTSDDQAGRPGTGGFVRVAEAPGATHAPLQSAWRTDGVPVFSTPEIRVDYDGRLARVSRVSAETEAAFVAPPAALTAATVTSPAAAGVADAASSDSAYTIYTQSGPAFDATASATRKALDANGLDVDGSGIRVGVISNSFNNLGEAQDDVDNGYLPAASKIRILQDLPFNQGQPNDDEGRAMMEVVHGLAPGASLDFCTSSGTAEDFQNGIQNSDQAFADVILALAKDGCKVICDDIGLSGVPWFQGGVVDKAIQTVEAMGVTYLIAAGNERSAASQTSKSLSDPAFQSAWKKTAITLSFAGQVITYKDALNFGNSGFQNITLAPGAHTELAMEWNQPWGHATSNLALVISQNGQVIQNSSTGGYGFFTRDENKTPDGQSTTLANDPYVDEQYDPDFPQLTNNTNQAITLQVSIVNLSGADPGFVKYISNGNGNREGAITIDGANAGTSVGHQESPDAITVGAVDAGNTPAFGNDPPLSEYFSSSGTGDQYFYDIDGNKLSTSRPLNVVDVSGIDDIATGDSMISDFFGTSCATPSVAAVAALMLEGNRALTQPDIQNLLQDTAIPMINPAVSGAGLVDAAHAIKFAETLVETAPGADWILGGTHLNDTLIAGGANNILLGGAGNDTYYIKSTSDQVIENSGEGVDTVHSTVSFSLLHDPYVENLILSGKAAINATGNAGANVLTGNAGANVINGEGGADTMTGAAGNDTYYVDNKSDKVVEKANGGTDTERASISCTLAANVERLILTGSGALSGNGNALANTITGNAGANVLSGAGGSDTLTGGKGADTFVYHQDFGLDHITDFTAGTKTGHDKIKIDHTLFASFSKLLAHTTDVGSSAVITYDSTDKITLVDVKKASLASADFTFA